MKYALQGQVCSLHSPAASNECIARVAFLSGTVIFGIVTGSRVEKMWAHLTIQQLLDDVDSLDNTEERTKMKEKASNLALQVLMNTYFLLFMLLIFFWIEPSCKLEIVLGTKFF